MSERAKAGQYSKGDRVYVKFAIDDFEIIGGNSYRKAVGVFEGEGTVDRAEDGYVFGRLDNGKTFLCCFKRLRSAAGKAIKTSLA